MDYKSRITNRAVQIDITGIGNFNTVKEAAMMANDVLRDEEFYKQIALHPFFDRCNTTPATIARLMRESAFTMTVDLYYALSPVKNIDGYDDPENPFVIHMNVWKIDRSPESMCNTIIHACVHAVNAYFEEYEFGHGDHSLNGKENTAPYWIGALAQRMNSIEDPIIIPLEHDVCGPDMYNTSKKFAEEMLAIAR